MANATDVWVTSLQGTDPQNLMPYMTRQHIYDCRFWKEECFGLTVTTVLSKAAQVLQCVGGTFGPNQQPTKFICLVLKLLQLQPDYDVIVEGFLHQDEFKYVRALGCFFLRLMTVARPYQVYQELEPLYRDFRKLRMRLTTSWTTIHMDEFIHTLVTQETCCGLAIPRLPLRHVLVQQGYIEDSIRRSALQDVVMTFQKENNNNHEDMKEDEDDDEDQDQLIDEKGLMAYLQHKAEQQQCVAAQVLLQARLQKKLLLQQEQQRGNANMNETDDADDRERRQYHDDDHHYYQPRHKDQATDDSTNRNLHNPSDVPDEADGQVQRRPKDPSTSKSSSSSKSKQHHDPSKRKYDNLFKKSKSKSGNEASKAPPESDDPAASDPAKSEAYWNEERAKLGLKPLKK